MAARKTASQGGKPDKLMRNALALELSREDVQDGRKVKRLRRVARALVAAAIGGDVSAIKEVFERMDGKTPQAISAEVAGTLTVTVKKMIDDGGGV